MKLNNDVSIHPRMLFPLEKRKVKNTCTPPRPPSKKLDRKRARLNARRNDHAATIKMLPQEAAAFKQPGSMKQGT